MGSLLAGRCANKTTARPLYNAYYWATSIAKNRIHFKEKRRIPLTEKVADRFPKMRGERLEIA